MLGGWIVGYAAVSSFKVLMFADTMRWAGVTTGALIGAFGLLLWIRPQWREILGILVIVLSLVSFLVADFGGFLVGMLLGLYGGSMAMAWMALPVPVPVTQPPREISLVDPVRVVDITEPLTLPEPEEALGGAEGDFRP